MIDNGLGSCQTSKISIRGHWLENVELNLHTAYIYRMPLYDIWAELPYPVYALMFIFEDLTLVDQTQISSLKVQ